MKGKGKGRGKGKGKGKGEGEREGEYNIGTKLGKLPRTGNLDHEWGRYAIYGTNHRFHQVNDDLRGEGKGEDDLVSI